MPDSGLCLEALSALSGCNVGSTPGPSPLSPQDFVNIVALREFYKQQGLEQLEYPGVGAMSLEEQDDQDVYCSPPALGEDPGPQESLRASVKINLEEFFHPQFNYDFTSVQDGSKVFLRGNERYFRPCGWNRVALRVNQKYDGNDVWLGTGKDAWPVSYHAHNMDGSLGVILTHDGSPEHEPGFLDAAAASLTTGLTKGRGVYSTPDIKMAEKYCKVFKSKADGKRYKVVLQNRINPENRRKCQREDVWLVYVPEGSNPVQTRAVVQDSIRPYGLLLKQL
ncbi:uncharacterized protein LOC133972257 [Platichthys flesus]|uniref:uncharacterized protein LOC133972257 n=1 Tax=Platichthys flesus TaxID=8260 RepID=UPI002DBC40AE|nr:uncharacterized protein LOC133972257 [Platichthys flesus]